jgi:hypothetical protein
VVTHLPCSMSSSGRTTVLPAPLATLGIARRDGRRRAVGYE